MRKLYAFWRCLLLDIKIVCTTLVTSECQYLSDFRSSTFDGVHAWTTQLASRAELAWIGLTMMASGRRPSGVLVDLRPMDEPCFFVSLSMHPSCTGEVPEG